MCPEVEYFLKVKFLDNMKYQYCWFALTILYISPYLGEVLKHERCYIIIKERVKELHWRWFIYFKLEWRLTVMNGHLHFYVYLLCISWNVDISITSKMYPSIHNYDSDSLHIVQTSLNFAEGGKSIADGRERSSVNGEGKYVLCAERGWGAWHTCWCWR